MVSWFRRIAQGSEWMAECEKWGCYGWHMSEVRRAARCILLTALLASIRLKLQLQRELNYTIGVRSCAGTVIGRIARVREQARLRICKTIRWCCKMWSVGKVEKLATELKSRAFSERNVFDQS